MKFFILTALLASVWASNRQTESTEQRPWQVGKVYQYDVDAYTLASLHEGPSSGNAFKTRFVIWVKAPGLLLAKLEDPQHATVHEQLWWKLPNKNELPNEHKLPAQLNFEPVNNLNKPFEITLEGARVKAINVPQSLSLQHENLLKGLIGTLQVDMTSYRNVQSPENKFDHETLQGQYRKMETDVTGDCSTLYTLSPVNAEWRRELPKFSKEEDPIEITKTKNYGHCHYRVAYHFGVPQGAVWTGVSDKPNEFQLMQRGSNSRILMGKQGPIYKAETTTTVKVHPHQTGKQKAEVLSYVRFNLVSYEDVKEPEWGQLEDTRDIQNLLYSVSSKKQVIIEDKSSSSESNESLEKVQVSRMRSSKIVSINKVIRMTQYQDQDSSSDSDSTFINDDLPMKNEPAYSALYMTSTSETNDKYPAVAQKLVQELAQLLQTSYNMPKADFLTKFNILVRIVAAMTSDQIAQTSRSIEAAKSSNNIVKIDMWMIYRDAVAQAGTLPAFKQIQSWIQSKKLQGEEAAEIVATLANTLRYPTKDLMLQFFKLAISPEVNKQKYLSTAALLAATRFINMGQVNNETAHDFYPTHMYGRLARKHDNFVHEEIIPQLRQHLDQAIQKDDVKKALVYIKALGHLAHRSILDVFAPYIEGKIVVSTYLRAVIVDNLRLLAKQKDSYTRNVLFRILRNTAEPEEIRLSAIEKMFISHPTHAMMQAMAQMTHDDPSVHVRAFIKSSIESTADMKDPRYWELIKTAQAARSMVSKDHFGQQYSMRSYMNHMDSETEFSVMDYLSYVGSKDTLLPKYTRFGMKGKTTRWNEIASSFSSIKDLADHFQKEMKSIWKQPPKSEVQHKYPASKISEMLNIKRDPHQPLQGDLYFNLMNQERYFTFSEEDLKQIPQTIRKLITEMGSGSEMHYTKTLNQAQVSVMFPLAMGMPFIYKYKEPTVVHIQAKAQGQINFGKDKKDLSALIKKEIQFTFARNIDGMVGFLDTLSNQWAKVGVVNKVQLDIPVKTEVQWKSGELKIHLEPLRPDQDITLAHFSVWPYSSNQKKDSIVPVSLDTTTKVISREAKVSNLDYRFGQSVGSVFQLQGYSYSTDYRNVASMFQSSDLFTNIAQMLYQRDVAQTHYNFRYLGKSSQNKKLSLTAVYDTYNNMKEKTNQPLKPTNMDDVKPNSHERREKMVKQVVSGINTAKAHVVDISATFDGPQKTEFILTAAIGHSPVDSKVQYTFFAGKNSQQGNNQINGVGSVKKPEVSSLNFVEALKKDLKMTFDAEIKLDQNTDSNIRVQGYSERTKKYSESLKNHFRAKQCQEEMASNNFYQQACHKMLIMAHANDYLKASVNYKGISPASQYRVYQIYRIAQHYIFWYTESNPLKTLPEGKLEIEMQNNYLENLMSLAINSKSGEQRLKNMPIPKGAAGFFSTYFPISLNERVMNYLTSQQYLPYCTVDASKVKTFSRRNMDYTLTSSWHVLMQNQAIKPDWPADELVVLARRPSEKQEIYISYRSEHGKALELTIEPSQSKPSVKVNTNTKKVSDGALSTYWDDVEEKPFLQYYTQPDGVLVLNIREDRLRLMYKDQTLVLLSNEDRNKTRGICGLMSGDKRDDYITPQGLVDESKHFAAAYSLDVEMADPQTQSLKAEAQKLAYKPQNHFTEIMVSNEDNNMEQMQQDSPSEDSEQYESEVYRVRGYSKRPGPCELAEQVQFYEKNGEICISTTPLDACQSHCKGQEYKIQSVQVVCKPWSDAEFQQYRNEIRKGENPQVSGVPKVKQYRVPTSCRG